MVEQAKEGPTRTNDANVDEDEDEDEFSAKEGNDKEGRLLNINITFEDWTTYLQPLFRSTRQRGQRRRIERY